MRKILNTALAAGACMAVSAGCMAGVPTVTSMFGGNLRIPAARTMLGPRASGPNWHIVGGEGGFEPAPDGCFHVNLHPSDDLPEVKCAVKVSNVEGGVHAAYDFVPDKDVSLVMLALEAQFKYADYQGGHVEADGRRVALPAGKSPIHFLSAKATNVVVSSGSGDLRITLLFDKPTPVLFQNNRTWGNDNFSIRISTGEKSPLKGGRKYGISMTIAGVGAYDPAGSRPVSLDGDPDWVPLAANPWIVPGSALDFSSIRATEAPAGKHGRVVARGGHFEFENLPGVPQRFYGINICGDANTPPLGSADRFAANLARAGYNAIRFHHHETDLVRGTGDPSATKLNPKRAERFDALVAACVKHGIYMTTDIYVSRKGITWRSVGEDRDGTLDMGSFKFLVPVHEGVWSNFVAFARNFLGHVNPYTGRSLAEEPAMVGISLVNEGPLDNKAAWYRQWPQWRAAWEKWLAAKKAADPARWGKVRPSIPTLYGNDATSVAFLVFLQEMEGRFAARTRAFLRDELKCRVPLTNMNNGSRRVFQPVSHDAYDYIDTHFYVDHPHFLGRAWRLPSSIKNVNPLKSPTLGGRPGAALRFFDRPYTITEYNYCGPGRFRGMGGIATGAEAALQDWSGLWRFAWSHGSLGVTSPEKKGVSSFDVANDPLQRASDLACVCLFLRGDMKPLANEYVVGFPRSELDTPSSPLSESASRPDRARVGWSAKYGTAFDVPTTAEMPPVPGPGSPVEIDEATGRFLISTPRTAGGFSEGGTILAGDVKAEVSGSSATVWASSLDGAPLASSSHILVVHLTDVQPRGIRCADAEKTILLAWGAPQPLVMRRGRADMSLRLAPGGYTVHSLASDGTRRGVVPASYADGRLSFVADVARDPASGSYIYEIVREAAR